jgi:folylpolyglutamate synthase
MSNNLIPDFVNHTYDSIAIAGLTLQSAFAEKWRELDPSPATVVKVLPSVEEALGYVRDLKSGSRDNAEYNAKDSEKEIHALITGSVHLVGRTLGILEGVDAL